MTNGDFSNLSGLTDLGGWYGGVPTGWSSPNTNPAYSVANTTANLQTLSNASNPFYQNVGTTDAVTTITLSFQVLQLQTTPPTVTVAIYNSTGAPFLTAALASGTYGVGSHTLVASNVPANTPITVAFSESTTAGFAGGLDNVSVIPGPRAATIPGAVLPQVARAGLPMLEQPWLGHFAVAIDRGFRFYVSANGMMELEPLGRNREPISPHHVIPVALSVEATTKEGVLMWLTVDPESLESADPATDKLRKTTLRGKAVGADPVAAVSFEATIERDGSTIFIGGRVTDPGPFRSPGLFSAHIMYPPAYVGELQTRAEWDKNQEKEFEKRTKRDVLELKYLDGKRSKLTFFEKIDANSKEVNGGGISSAMVSIAYFPDMALNVTAEANSALSLWHPAPAPLSDAFRFIWRPDPAKDPEHKARLVIRVK